MTLVLYSALAFFGTVIGYHVFRRILTYLDNQQTAKEHGCKPAIKLAQKRFLLGAEVVLANLRAARNKTFLQLLRHRHERYGNTFTSYTFGRITINTCDPQVIKDVLALKFDDFDMGKLRRKSAGPLLGKGIFTVDNQLWEHSRALIRPAFTKHQLVDLSTFEKHVDHLIELLPKDGSIVDLQSLFFRMVLDSNTEFLLGESVNLLSSESSTMSQDFHKALDYAQQGTILRLRMGNIMFAHKDQKFTKACQIVSDFTEQYVRKAIDLHKSQRGEKAGGSTDPSLKEAGGEKYVFLNELAKETENQVILRDQIVNVLLAARDTTAGLLSFTLFILARRPDVWSKLCEEVLSIDDEELNYERIKGMTYLRYVLQESLRLFPPIATNSRMANKDTILSIGGGPEGKDPLFVKKNQVVTYSTYVMHRRKDLFGDDADLFRPERWATIKPGWDYLPFNGGPRICPGQMFALTEAGYTTVRLVKAFKEVRCCDGRPWMEQLTLSLTLNNGCMVSLVPDSTLPN